MDIKENESTAVVKIYMQSGDYLFNYCTELLFEGYRVVAVTQLSPFKQPDNSSAMVCNWMVIYEKRYE
jgi:hypothetical protein